MAQIQNVVKGDIIVERVGGKNRMTPVRKVEINACSKPSVHINGNTCWDWGTHVRLAESEGTLQDLESAVGDLESDNQFVEKEMTIEEWENYAQGLVRV